MFQPDLLKGRKILITGGGTGPGKAMGRRTDMLDETAAEFGARVTTHGLDVRDAEAVAADGMGTQTVPLGRVGEHHELADLATFLMSDGSGYINGEVVTIDGGEWLQGAGQFNFLRSMTDDDWAAMKPKKS